MSKKFSEVKRIDFVMGQTSPCGSGLPIFLVLLSSQILITIGHSASRGNLQSSSPNDVNKMAGN